MIKYVNGKRTDTRPDLTARIAQAMNAATLNARIGAVCESWDVGLAYCSTEQAAEAHVARCESIAERARRFGTLVCKLCETKAAMCNCNVPARRRVKAAA